MFCYPDASQELLYGAFKFASLSSLHAEILFFHAHLRVANACFRANLYAIACKLPVVRTCLWPMEPR